jgi:hypothetical protein
MRVVHCAGVSVARRRALLLDALSPSAHRAGIRRAELAATAALLRLAYADPPYPGKSALYRDHRDYAGEVDHEELLERLQGYDGWALSTSADALPAILATAVARGLDITGRGVDA